MIEQALLYLACPGDLRSALLPVAGRPVGFRAVATAVRAGVRRVGVPAAFRGTPIELAIDASPSIRAATWWIDAAAPPPDGPVLLLPAAAVVAPVAVASVAAAPTPSVLAGSTEQGAPVVGASPELIRGLWTCLAEARPLPATLARDLASAARTSSTGWYVRVATASAVPEAEAALLATLASPIDTPLDTVFHRRCSRPLSRLAIVLGITPNQMSLASLAAGLVATWCVARATPPAAVVGVLLYALAVVLDHADGEVARLALAESRLGEWLDVVIDTIIHALLVVAMGLAVAHVTGRGAHLGPVAAVGIVASAALAKLSPVTTGGAVGRLLDRLGTRDAYYALLLGFVLALAAWPAALLPLMVLVTAGSHAYWLGRAVYRLWPPNTARKPK